MLLFLLLLKPLLANIPVTVLTPIYNTVPESTDAKGRVRYGECSVLAHSNGLPCHLSTDDIHIPTGRTTINRSPPNDVKTLRIANPEGRLCCVLTVLGSSSMNPGGPLYLQFDLPSNVANRDSWIPCYQIAACLEGQEMSILEGGTKRRTRSYLFDTAHETVDGGCTERLGLSLLLPLDCPCSLKTDLVEVNISCRVDLTVDGDKDHLTYSNLRLDIPINVLHGSTGEEMERLDEPPQHTSIDDYIDTAKRNEPMGPQSSPQPLFRTSDIIDELKILSLQMLEKAELLRST